MSPSLLTFTLKDFRAQLRRLVLTGSAVAVGVAFLVLSVGGAGALVQSYEQSAAADVGDAAVQVVPGGTEGSLPAGAAAAAARVPEVTSVAERLAGHANVIAPSGRPLDDRALVTSIAADPALRWQRLDAGRWPEGPGEFVLDRERRNAPARSPADVRVTRADGGRRRPVAGILDASAPDARLPAGDGVPHAQAWRARGYGSHLDLCVAPGGDALAVAEGGHAVPGRRSAAYAQAGAWTTPSRAPGPCTRSS
ncbi:ABC transporter permease [Streptomyces tanashiensis]